MMDHCGDSSPCSNSDVAVVKLSRCRPELVDNSLLLVGSGPNCVTSGFVASQDVAKTGN